MIAADREKHQREATIEMLHGTGISVHRLGYKYLTLAIPRYAMDDSQSLTKEIYPDITRQFGCADWHSVERSIRTAILDAWERRGETDWVRYFPNRKRPPSNKLFIATLAEKLQ